MKVLLVEAGFPTATAATPNIETKRLEIGAIEISGACAIEWCALVYRDTAGHAFHIASARQWKEFLRRSSSQQGTTNTTASTEVVLSMHLGRLDKTHTGPGHTAAFSRLRAARSFPAFQGSKLPATPHPFGQQPPAPAASTAALPSGGGQQVAAPSGFGQALASPCPFGQQPPAPAASTAALPSGFGQALASPCPFGQQPPAASTAAPPSAAATIFSGFPVGGDLFARPRA